jgi:hypothetical protein
VGNETGNISLQILENCLNKRVMWPCCSAAGKWCALKHSRFKRAVCSLAQLRVVVLDLSKVQIVEAGRLGMLVSLHNWAGVNGIHLKLVNPSRIRFASRIILRPLASQEASEKR